MRVAYKIEKNIPTPKTRSRKRCYYPFKDMEVGDSFMLEKSPGQPIEYLQNTIICCANKFKKRNKLQYDFASRVINNKTAVRIWRTK